MKPATANDLRRKYSVAFAGKNINDILTMTMMQLLFLKLTSNIKSHRN
jgi:hypothetical protein